MKNKDHVCEMTIKRLIDARKRQCEYSFQRYLDDMRERLEILDDEAMWLKYGHLVHEQFEPDPKSC